MGINDKRVIDGEWMTEEECYIKYRGYIWTGVGKVLKGAYIPPNDFEDFISVGTEGFIKAYRNFDESKGYRFSTYAVSTVWGTVMSYFNGTYNLIRKSRSINKSQIEMGDDLKEMSAKDLAEKYNITIKEVDIIRRSVAGVFSLERSMYQDEDREGSSALSAYVGKEDDVSQLYVDEFLKKVSNKHRTIIELLLDGKSQKEIDVYLKMSQPQVSREVRKIRTIYKKWDRTR